MNQLRNLGLDVMTAGRLKQWGMGLAALALPLLASAQGAAADADAYEPERWQLNMTPGVTGTSRALRYRTTGPAGVSTTSSRYSFSIDREPPRIVADSSSER